MKEKFCQSCGMPLNSKELLGRNADESKNEEYCKYCYQNGVFTQDITMEEMIESCIPHMIGTENGMSEKEARELLQNVIPRLKRWGANVVKVYRQSVPALRFIGKKYGEEDRADGGFGKRWGDWFANGWFEVLENDCKKMEYEDSGAYIGLMRWKEGEPFEYWIGMFCPENNEVAADFAFVDFKKADLGVAWLYGKENEIYGREHLCAESCEKEGFQIITDDQGAFWFFERYACPRFTTPDEKGNIILDICHFIAEE